MFLKHNVLPAQRLIYVNGKSVRGAYKENEQRALGENAGWNFSSAANNGEMCGGMLLQFEDQVMRAETKLEYKVSPGYCYKYKRQKAGRAKIVNFCPKEKTEPSGDESAFCVVGRIPTEFTSTASSRMHQQSLMSAVK